MFFNKKIPKNMEFVIRSLIDISFILIIIIGVTLVYANETQKIKPSSDYEKTNNMKVISVGPKVENYYKKKFSLKDSLKDFTGTQTQVNTIVQDENDKTKNVTFDVNVYEEKKNKRIILQNNGYDVTYKSDIRLMNDYLYTMCDVSDKKHDQNAYAACKYDKSIDLSAFTKAYDMISFFINNDIKYSVTYNCRTQKNGIDYDDITICFKKDWWNTSLQILVNSKTLKTTYIISNLLSEDDMTTVVYTKSNVKDFTETDVKDSPVFDKDHKKKDLPNGTKGSLIGSEKMIDSIAKITLLSTYGNIDISAEN